MLRLMQHNNQMYHLKLNGIIKKYIVLMTFVGLIIINVI